MSQEIAPVPPPAHSRKSACFIWCRAVSLFLGIAVLGTLADLFTKNWAFQTLGLHGTTHWIWQDIAGFQTTLNTGGLFGIGQGQTIFFVSFSLIFLAGIICYVCLAAWRSMFLSAVFGMITAGICGNLYDRLGWHGLVIPEGFENAGQQIYAVRDWILVMIGTFHWPNFNIADVLLVSSISLLLIYYWFFEETKNEEKKKEDGNDEISNAK